MDSHAYVFTDGSCTGTGLGAWATLIVVPKVSVTPLYGTLNWTTINRCELEPIVAGLRYIERVTGKGKPGFRVTVVSDSQTTVRVIAGEYKAKSNADLWDAYYTASANMNVKAIWRERRSHEYMIYVDNLCHSLREQAKKTFKRVPTLLPANDLPLEDFK